MFAVVHYYYKLGWPSTKIANELRIKPPMIRQWLRRLNFTADGVKEKQYKQKIGKKWPDHVWQRMFILRVVSGKSFAECARIMGYSQEVLRRAWKNCFGKLNVRAKTRKVAELTIKMERTVDGGIRIRYSRTAASGVRPPQGCTA